MSDAEFATELQSMLDREGGAHTGREVFEWWEKSFGDKVRQWRKARSWSQEDLAQRLTDLGFDVHQTTVAKIERGGRPLRVAEAVALAQILRVPTLAVFYGPGPDTEPASIRMMRKKLEQVNEGLDAANRHLQEAADNVGYWETERASLAKALAEAALKAENRDSET